MPEREREFIVEVLLWVKAEDAVAAEAWVIDAVIPPPDATLTGAQVVDVRNAEESP